MNGKKDDSSQERDRLSVAAIYRRIADETAPGELNSSVLRHAAKQTRGVTNRALTWLRPAALAATLAATLALSVALVLQIGNLDSTRNSSRDLVSPVASGQNDNVFDAAAEASMEQIRAAESAAQLSPGPSESLAAPQNQFGPSAPASNEISPDNQDCSAEQRSSTITWWQCIQALEKRGMSEAARKELEALFEAHPAFGVPE